MTLTAARDLGWDFESRLTSDELNHLQAELLKAIDGAGGGTYTLGGDLIFEGAATRFRGVLEVDDGGEFVVVGGATWLLSGSGEIFGEYVLSGDGSLTGILQVLEDGALRIEEAGLLRVDTDGFFVAALGSIAVFGGSVTFNADSLVNFASSAINLSSVFNVLDDASIDVEGGGRINVLGGGKIVLSNNAEIEVDDANDIEIIDGDFDFRLTLTPASISTDSGGSPQFVPFAGLRPVWFMSDVTDPAVITFALPILAGDTITELAMNIGNIGIDPHVGVPATRPKLQLYSLNINGGETPIGEITDPKNTLPDYDNTHAVPLVAGLPHTVQPGELLIVAVTNERGANAESNRTAVLSIYGKGLARHYRGPNEVY